MRRLGRHSTAELYHAAGAHFRRFLGGDRPLTSITATMVDDFRGYLKGLRLRVNTINSYLSGLRAVYNAACRERGIARTVHPFAHLRLRREATAKRAIPVRAIERMAATDWSDSPDLQRAADLALFSFLAQGMPLADILALRKSDIRGNVLTYYRRKTGTRIQLRVSPGMRGLLRKYRAPSAYLFPFGSDPDRRGAYKYYLSCHNRALREIGRRLRIGRPVTSYVMRHSWASEALRQSIPVECIRQAMGHSSERVTRVYLRSLDVSALGRANRKVIRTVDGIVARKKVT